MTYLAQLAQRDRERRTSLPREAFERLLTCSRCGALIACFEAAYGARSNADHQHLDPHTYVCGGCMKPKRLSYNEFPKGY